MASLTRQEESLAANLDKEASEDAGAVFLGWLSFGIVQREIGGNEALESRYASTLGRYDATLKEGFTKKCNLNPDVGQITRVSAQARSGDSDSVLDFYGEAEEEINTNTYDKHLWDKALIETGGDQTKRKTRYIELRANQLYSEKVGSVATVKAGGDKDISGIYVSEITSSGAFRKSYFQKDEYRKLEITLKQTNNIITGTDGFGTGTIEGTRTGNVIHFTYWSPNSRISNFATVHGKWKIKRDDSTLDGSWFSKSTDGSWNLRRTIGLASDTSLY